MAFRKGVMGCAVAALCVLLSKTARPTPFGPDDIQAQSAQTFYVATNGNDSNNGSANAPWRTIQHAINAVSAGDTVYVRGGVYNQQVTISKSGSPSAYITLASYPGEQAVIDGTGLGVPGAQAGLITIQNSSYLTVSGLEIRNYSTATTADVPIGVYVTGADSYIQLLRNHIHNIKTSAVGCNANALGLAVYGSDAPASINHLTISGNQVDHLTTGCSESVSLSGNVQYFSVTNNVIHDNNNIGIDVIGFEGTAPNSVYDQARDGEISANSIYNITSYGNPAYGNQYAADGIYIDGGTRVTVERNRVHNVDLGIEVASEHLGRTSSYVTVRSNLVYFDNANGISIGGYDSSVGGTDHCTIVNNTLFENDSKNTGSGEFQIQYHATNNVFKSNILYSTNQDLFINNYTTSVPNPADVDFNLYYSPDGMYAGQWVWEATTYVGFATYKSRTGKDPHSKFADPGFLNLRTPDLRVSASSPAVNAGVNLGAAVVGTLDFAGKPRVQGANIDVGAYEQ